MSSKNSSCFPEKPLEIILDTPSCVGIVPRLHQFCLYLLSVGISSVYSVFQVSFATKILDSFPSFKNCLCSLCDERPAPPLACMPIFAILSLSCFMIVWFHSILRTNSQSHLCLRIM